MVGHSDKKTDQILKLKSLEDFAWLAIQIKKTDQKTDQILKLKSLEDFAWLIIQIKKQTKY